MARIIIGAHASKDGQVYLHIGSTDFNPEEVYDSYAFAASSIVQADNFAAALVAEINAALRSRPLGKPGEVTYGSLTDLGELRR